MNNQSLFPLFNHPRQLIQWGATAALVTGIAVGCSNPTGGETAQTYEAKLATHLSDSGATMYGAYWCPHCADQKAMFGDAADQLSYVECDPEGENAQPELCQQKNIQGYPTWEIDGQLYPGVQPLDQLADLSGFTEAPPQQ